LEQNIGKSKEITITDPELIHQLANVFRFKVGEKVIVFDGSGSEYEAEIISLTKKEVVLDIKKSNQGGALINRSVSLYLSLIKKGNFELAVEKCTEVGVMEIHPIISERSEKKDLNLERINKIVKEASEQSGRVALPKIFEVIDLEEAVSLAMKDNKVCVVFHTEAANQGETLNREKGLSLISSKNIAIFIGPEGGFTEKEMELFKKNNFQIRSLGQNILRAETAAIVAVWESLKI
jgi:16S rRNA (uracil1498-N3)-methyltransferase